MWESVGGRRRSRSTVPPTVDEPQLKQYKCEAVRSRYLRSAAARLCISGGQTDSLNLCRIQLRDPGFREQTSDLFQHAWDRLKQFPRHDVICCVEAGAELSFFFFFSSTFNSSQVVQSFFFGGPLGRRIVRPLCVFKKSFKAPSQKVIYYRTGNTEHSVPASLQHHVYITHGCS